MSNGKISAMTSGKFSEFKKEEYNTMMMRIEAINTHLTEKCDSLSLMPLGLDFSFCFEFTEIHSYLKKIEDFDKKQRKDPLKKWWMNQKASEMASSFLPAILDQMDSISFKLSKQEKSELLQNKLMKYMRFALLQCAMECKFTRPRAAAASVFPNTSFQYARSRLRKKLENVYFNETEINGMKPNDKKKKEEWIKLIKIKLNKYKNEYYVDKLKKQKHRKKQKQMMKNALLNRSKMPSISISSSITISNSIRSSSGSSDLPIMDLSNRNDHYVPPPPPPLPAINDKRPMFLNHNHNPNHKQKPKRSNGYCSQCTQYSIQLSKLTEDLQGFKLSLGSTQMQLEQSLQELDEWKMRYKDKCSIIKSYESGNGRADAIHWKQKYDAKCMELKRLQSQIGSLIANTNTTTSSSASGRDHKVMPNILFVNNDSNGMYNECSDDRMSISGEQYNIMPQNENKTQLNSLMKEHLQHNSNSTEQMLEQLRSEHKEEHMNGNNEYGMDQEEESLLLPITTNIRNNSQSVISQATTQSTFSMNHSNNYAHSNYANVDMLSPFNDGSVNNNNNNDQQHHRSKQHILQNVPISNPDYYLNARNPPTINGNGYWNTAEDFNNHDMGFPPALGEHAQYTGTSVACYDQHSVGL